MVRPNVTQTSALTRPAPIRRLSWALGVNQLLSWATSFYVPAVITAAAAREMGVSAALLMGGFSWALLITGLCAPRVGRWIGRHGGRGPLAASTIILALGLLLLAWAPGVAGWYIAWTVVGIGMALGLYDAAFATVGTLLGPAVAPAITGISLLGGFASTLGWPAGTALLGALDWRGVLLVYAAVQVGVNLPLVLWAVPRTTITAAEKPATAARTSTASRWRTVMLVCMGSFFTLRWFITSAMAAHVLPLMAGLNLSATQAMTAAMLIGPGQVAGRLLEWGLAARIGPLWRARLGALLFPAGALLLLSGSPFAAFGFALLYGMSNGILTINRGTLPMLVFGPAGYAALLGWIALPVLLAQAAAPTLAAPVITALPAPVLLITAGCVAGLGACLLLPLRARAAE
jgi:hypothetical protein